MDDTSPRTTGQQQGRRGRYSQGEIRQFVEAAQRDGHCTLPEHFPRDLLEAWNAAFLPLLHAHIEREGHLKNRGPGRYYVTLPFVAPWAEPLLYEDPDVLAVVEGLVGADPVMCQLATDTPLKGSDFQDVHRDTPPLFPEWGRETPAFQLAVNFPLVEVTPEHGPIEIAPGTHMLSRQDAMARIAAGEIVLQSYPMKLGDVMIRDVRHLHRGTPNRTHEPRPMVVIGYSRKWLFRPEVHIDVPRETWDGLTPLGRHLLRYNPIVESVERLPAGESYQAFAY